MTTLAYNEWKAGLAGVKETPEEHIKLLGITYKLSVSPPFAEQWYFLNCVNVPRDIPEYISVQHKEGSDE